MSLENRSETRRFITLIDTLYDQKVMQVVVSLHCTALVDILFGLCNIEIIPEFVYFCWFWFWYNAHLAEWKPYYVCTYGNTWLYFFLLTPVFYDLNFKILSLPCNILLPKFLLLAEEFCCPFITSYISWFFATLRNDSHLHHMISLLASSRWKWKFSLKLEIVGPISWGHSCPLCHALSLLSSLSSSSLWTSHAACAIAIAGVRLVTPGDWQCNSGSQ